MSDKKSEKDKVFIPHIEDLNSNLFNYFWDLEKHTKEGED